MIRGSDVTVVIPTIPGREEFLRRAVASVDAQEIQPGAVVVHADVDRRGAAFTRNAALERVQTDWIAFLDDDDELLPNHLRTLVRGANVSGADLIYTYAEFVGRDDPLAVLINGRIIPTPIHVPWSRQAEWSLRHFGNFIPVTNLVRTHAVRVVGGFPSPFTFDARVSRECEDYGLLIKLLSAGYTFHHVVGVRTWRYHVHGANTGGRGVG